MSKIANIFLLNLIPNRFNRLFFIKFILLLHSQLKVAVMLIVVLFCCLKEGVVFLVGEYKSQLFAKIFWQENLYFSRCQNCRLIMCTRRLPPSLYLKLERFTFLLLTRVDSYSFIKKSKNFVWTSNAENQKLFCVYYILKSLITWCLVLDLLI